MKLNKENNKKNIFELIRFAIVGGAATVVDLAVTIVLVHFTNFHENIITSLAFITAFWVSFFGHRYFTFKKKGSPVSFFILSISTFLLRNVFVLGLVSVNIRGYYALISSMILVTAITYFVAKFKVFKE